MAEEQEETDLSALVEEVVSELSEEKNPTVDSTEEVEADPGKRGVEEEVEETVEEETTEEASGEEEETEEALEFSEQLLKRAAAVNISARLAQKYPTPDLLEETVELLESGKPEPEKKEPEVDPFDQKLAALKEAGYEDDVLDVVKGIRTEFREELDALKQSSKEEREEAGWQDHVADVTEQLDDTLAEWSEEYGGIFGKGVIDELAETSEERKARLAVAEDFTSLGGFDPGKTTKQISAILRKAVNANFPDAKLKKERSTRTAKARAQSKQRMGSGRAIDLKAEHQPQDSKGLEALREGASLADSMPELAEAWREFEEKAKESGATAVRK